MDKENKIIKGFVWILILSIFPVAYLANYDYLTLKYVQIYIGSIMLGAVIAGMYRINQRKEISKIRKIDLENFAKNNDYTFYKVPLSLEHFRSFDVLNNILCAENLDGTTINLSQVFFTTHRYKNHLVSQEAPFNEIFTIDTFNRGQQGQSDQHAFFTQVFLFKIKKNIPKFYISGNKTLNWRYKFPFFTSAGNSKELKKINFKNYNFPNDYLVFMNSNDADRFITRNFVDLLNQGIKSKQEKICIESNGNSLIFFVYRKRHDLKEMDSYLNLFNHLIRSLNL